jgi:hypothetical protein
MNKLFIGLFLLSFVLAGCHKEAVAPAPAPGASDSDTQFLSSDTLTRGGYLGFNLGETPEASYATVQSLRIPKGIFGLSVTANSYRDLSPLREKIPLYLALYLNEQRGSSTGVQFAFEAGKVKSIYLNSGKQLTQWPDQPAASSSVAVGDQVEVLYEKLVQIKDLEAYGNKFERISLSAKDLTRDYDPNMGLSPQWYFTYKVDTNKFDEVQLHFRGGKLSFIVVNHWLRHS